MKKFLLILALCLSLISVRAETPEDVTPFLDEISVTVKSNGGEGSGVVKVRDGVCYVVTAGHVVADNRHTRNAIFGGRTETVIEYDDVKVIKHFVEDGRDVGTATVMAEIIAYSSSVYGDDVAILRIRRANFTTTTTKFYSGKTIPAPGSPLYHCGSLHGDFGSNSLTTGVLARTGRLLKGKLFDQTTVTALPGSSGGGVFLQNGEYIGMLVRGGDATFNFITPIRRLKLWAKGANLEFIFDDTKPVTPDDKIIKEKGEPADKNILSSILGGDEDISTDDGGRIHDLLRR